jgi:hypothetical protein
MEDNFKDILEKGEKISKTFKPDKVKYWWAFILTTLICTVWVFAALAFSIPDEGQVFDPNLFWLLLIISCSTFTGILLISILFGAVYYRNRLYAYTNKRIIVRTGIIGVDYKSLDYRFVSATTVSVTALDKILRRNTGNLRFGSPASPMGGTESISPYTFKHILKPYEALREINETIDAKK